ncbi:MAG: c-type cytochrome [Candidatus Binatia bacterium]
MRILLFALTLALAAALSPAPSQADDAPRDLARRMLTLLRGIAGEYREAFDDAGQLVRKVELEEAELLLVEARARAGSLDAGVRSDVESGLGALAETVRARGPTGQVAARVETLCRTITERTGVAEEVLPPAPASAERGRAIYRENCERCHGATGRGDGPDAVDLESPPANFADPEFIRGEMPEDFFNVVTLGRRQSGMPAWGDVLSVQERWDAVAYLWSFGATPAVVAAGERLYRTHCAACHDVARPAVGARVAPPSLATLAPLAARTDAALLATVATGRVMAGMPGFAPVLDAEQRAAVVAYVRTRSLAGTVTPTGPAPGGTGVDDLAAIRALVDRALDAGRHGDPRAPSLATDAYLRFEPLEPRIGALDQAAVRRTEEAFLALRGALVRGATPAEIDATAAALRHELAQLEPLLATTADAWARFAQSATIILREGFEVVLVIGALASYVRRSGESGMTRWVHGGALAGVVASLATAALLMTVLRMTPGLSELLEGATMLLAAGVLFGVSYWLVSKAEADTWQRYLQGKVQHALAAGSGGALALAAFLAVYREGFETVLFYEALLASAPARDLMVGGGFLAGSVALAAIYAGFTRLELRIPIRPFFLVTGGLLYAMAIAFAGQGIHELQEAGAVSVTPVAGVPTIAALGLFASRETLAAQGVLVSLLVVGLVVSAVRGRRDRSTARFPS